MTPYSNDLDYRNDRSGYKVNLGWMTITDNPAQHYFRTTQGSVMSVSLCFIVSMVKKLHPFDNRMRCVFCETYIATHPNQDFSVSPENTPDNPSIQPKQE